MILNPPQINSKLPAFCGASMVVPFQLNRSVGRKQFNSMSIIVKSVQTNVEKYSGTTKAIAQNYFTHGYEATFNFDNSFTPQPGQYYKVQIAFIDDVTDENNPVVGHYSTVGVIKCTTRPSVTIKDREENLNHTYSYTGVYSQQGGDITEKIYSYCFNLYDESNNLIATSGEQIHNSSNDGDKAYESTDTWVVHKALEQNVNYTIEYKITTMNGLNADVSYTVIDAQTIAPNIHATLEAEPVVDDGYNKVYLKCKKEDEGKNIKVSGSFVLLRSSSEDNFDSWYEMTRFQLSQWDISTIREICKDYTIWQGFEYKYAIQAYNSLGLYSDRVESGLVVSDFEDAFLYDGERQLKIRFNPKVSSFKSTILETKTNTIGGKYPFIFRNGNVEYKEFQISGLLSILGDENDEFLTGLPRELAERRTSPAAAGYVPGMDSWLTGDNYRRERQFKMEVLAWLTNGKPKLFRSPAEGNFIVQLMNTSLTPNDTLGRMLHTFQSTACEIAECTFENLQKYGFTVEPYTEARILKINQINLNNVPAHLKNEDGTIVIPNAYLASISADPDIDFTYTLSNNAAPLIGNTNLTGTYVFPEGVLKVSPLTTVKLMSDSWGDVAYLTYGYYDETVDNFSYIQSISIADQIVQQPGLGLYAYDNSNNVIYTVDKEGRPIPQMSEIKNIIPILEDFRIQTGAFHYIRVKTKTLHNVMYSGGQWWFDKTSQVTIWNPTCLYRVALSGKEYLIDGNNPPVANNGIYPQPDPINDTTYIDPLKEIDLYLFKLEDSNEIDFSGNEKTDGRYDALTNISSINKLYAGKGLVLDMVYQQKEILYAIESENVTIQEYKQAWLNSKAIYDAANAAGIATEAQKNDMNGKYSAYIVLLENEASKLKEEYNIEYAI